MPEIIDFSMVDKIIKETVAAIEVSKASLFDIAESAKSVQKRMQSDFEQVCEEVGRVIETVDRLEANYKKARIHLMDVSRDFTHYSEEDIKKAYLQAQEFQIKVAVEKEKEKGLRLKRDELARSIAKISEMSVKAEELVSKVDIALTFLSGNLAEFSQQMGGLQQKQLIGGRIILAQEAERKRVAREIHDGPAQAMANVVLRAELCEKLLKSDRAAIHEELHQLKLIVRESLQEVRRIIFNLRPMTLDDLGLVPTLRRFLEEIQARETETTVIHLEIHGEEKRLPNSYEIALFRLVQEGINNAHKHSHATQIKTMIDFLPEEITVRIIDNGVGFDYQKILNEVSGKESYGLLSMKERLELLNGKLLIQSAPNQGTTILASVPIE
ncbi:two-component system sensor histidine kinase DegS [Hydrogenispora ethanolica]|jgi:two-component system sensor histidine kinase DegS|uniref:histidine kinase n=1 Tax=Hydrogenispora ethanolica TaxID=1082276 RepID=A0A4R1RC19_HYDET|nr:sensor histidine kinase [Hydrogenispora ethanolica]TCL63002.1 two-component system sensor histidine kinase DegS [Hydrogenispora ethanolica]